jgi:hypothetical protein
MKLNFKRIDSIPALSYNDDEDKENKIGSNEKPNKMKKIVKHYFL